MQSDPSSGFPPATLPPYEEVAVRVLHRGRCHLGEGPAYDAASDTAWWFDILERRLYEARLATEEVTVHALPMMASALAVVDDRHQLLVAEDGLYLRDRHEGHLVLHAALPPSDIPLRSNDARVHPSGTLWFSTMGRHAEAGAGAIHAFHRRRVQTLFSSISIPNAMCFAPDGRFGYFTDTARNELMRVPLDPASGLPVAAPERLLRHAGPGGLDGAVTDAEGLIWCAHWGGGCIVAYSPAGEVLRRLRVPALQVSCPVFVGADFATMLVTSAFESMDDVARAGDHHHGRTFMVHPGAIGRPEPRIRMDA